VCSALLLSRYLIEQYQARDTKLAEIVDQRPIYLGDMNMIMLALEEEDVALPEHPRVCLRGLPCGMSREELVAQLRSLQLPTVVNIDMPMRGPGQTKGIAFVTFTTVVDAGHAIEILDETTFGGRQVDADEATAPRSGRR
jgi:RNA recognition motif-containing protein